MSWLYYQRATSKILIPAWSPRDSQCHVSQRCEGRPAGRIQRDIAPMLVNVDQEQTQRVYHDDRFEIQQALKKDKSLDVVGVLRLWLQLKTSNSVIASVEAVFPLPHHPQRDLHRPRTARFLWSVQFARRFWHYQSLERRKELVSCTGNRDDMTRLALPIQCLGDVKMNIVVVTVVQHE